MTDRDDIAELLVRYATGIDSRDWDLFRTCFTSDVRADYTGIGQWDGVEEITRFMIEAHTGPSLHRLSNITITVTGDAASARTYVDAVVLGPDGSGVNAIGFYDDELVRTDDGWRIATRSTTSIRITVLGGLEVRERPVS